MAPTNREIAAAFTTVAGMIELQDGAMADQLRYLRVSQAILDLPRELHIIVADGKLPHYRAISPVATAITEYLATGSFPLYDQLAAQAPPDLVQVMRVAGIGPRKARLLWQEQGISNLAGLQSALENGRLAPLLAVEPDRLLSAINRQTQRPAPWLLGKAHPAAEDLLETVLRRRQVVDGAVVGSIRRRCPMVNNINLLVAVAEQSQIAQVIWDFANRANFMPVGRRGRADITVELRGGYQIDLQVVTTANWGAALVYYTGSPAHTARLRQRASERGLRFHEGELTRVEGSETGPIPCDTEEAFYAALGLPWIAPELREDAGEIEAAAAGTLPDLITPDAIQGDLHLHTSDSDGKRAVREMVEEARQRGHKYIAITDHSRSLDFANGLSIDRLMEQQAAVRRLDAEMNGSIRVLQGLEMDILPDGRLDTPDEVLEKLDIVIASLHVRLQQDQEQTTRRLLNAIRSPHVDIIGHPRSFWRAFQQPVEADMDAVLAAAQEHDTALEINANPERLDIDGPLARQATEMGIKLAINTDAHYPAMLDILEYGVYTARRGWVQADSVLNTWSLEKLQRWLQTREAMEDLP